MEAKIVEKCDSLWSTLEILSGQVSHFRTQGLQEKDHKAGRSENVMRIETIKHDIARHEREIEEMHNQQKLLDMIFPRWMRSRRKLFRTSVCCIQDVNV